MCDHVAMSGMASTSENEVDQMLQSAVRQMRSACGVDLTFGGPRSLSAPNAITIRHLDGNLAQSLRHLRVRAGSGLGGKALASGKPAMVRDYFNADEIVHTYDQAVAPEKIYTALAIPVMLDRAPAGLLYLAHRSTVVLGDRTVARAMTVVRRLERDLLVNQEVRRRVAEQLTHTRMELVGELRDELESIIDLVHDPVARRRLSSMSDRLRRLAPDREASAGGPLSKREADVLRLVALGAKNNDIAADLGLRPNTVKAYLRSINRKLGASNRTHAVRLARQAGLLD